MYVSTGPQLCSEGEAAVVDPEDLKDASGTCGLFVTPHAATVLRLLPPMLRDRVVSVESVDARYLLDPAGRVWPASRQESEETTQPIYVRPPVFVKPRNV